MEKSILVKELFDYAKVFSNEDLLKLRGVRFSYFLEKNLNMLDSKIASVRKELMAVYEGVGQLPDSYLEAEKVLVEKYADKDANGNVLNANGGFRISKENHILFKQEMDALVDHENDEVAKAALKVSDRVIAENDILTREVIIDFYTIKEEYLPENINTIERIPIKDFIVE